MRSDRGGDGGDIGHLLGIKKSRLKNVFNLKNNRGLNFTSLIDLVDLGFRDSKQILLLVALDMLLELILSFLVNFPNENVLRTDF